MTHTPALVEAVARYGGRCRDCADSDGMCVGSRLPCDPDDRRKAIEHVLSALTYHGHLPAARAEGVGELVGLIADWERLEAAFHDALPSGQGEPGDDGVAGRAMCQFLYDNSETIRAALSAQSTVLEEREACAKLIEQTDIAPHLNFPSGLREAFAAAIRDRAGGRG